MSVERLDRSISTIIVEYVALETPKECNFANVCLHVIVHVTQSLLRMMAHGKDVCGSCSAPIKRQSFIVCSGPCSRTFHCLCVGIRNEDYDLLVAKGVSTFKCSACTKRHDPESIVLETNPPSNDSAVTNGTPQEMQQEPTTYEQFELRQLSENESLQVHVAKNTELLRNSLLQKPAWPSYAATLQSNPHHSVGEIITKPTSVLTRMATATSVNSDTGTTHPLGALLSSGVPKEPHLQDNESAGTALGPAAQGNQNDSDDFIAVQRKRRPQSSVGTGANSLLDVKHSLFHVYIRRLHVTTLLTL
ncbi:hypothetical protein HPB47_019162 [Ixodes persulcatus]|uniref:Uncharacterized protein n=1 Tax=Ixodes persulcatus TaxID=34615 RepID=A0AC60QMI1_IXOPE|nr:hypothetical protein HPB47_019162 [Ixodes persulcatus]